MAKHLTQEDLDRHLFKACQIMSHAALRDSDNHLEYVRLALDAGANPNAKPMDVHNSGNTPLHYAAYCIDDKLARLLVSHGADLHARNKSNQTPLDIVSAMGDLVFAEYLKNAASRQAHLTRLTKERSDKGPPQVGG